MVQGGQKCKGYERECDLKGFGSKNTNFKRTTEQIQQNNRTGNKKNSKTV